MVACGGAGVRILDKKAPDDGDQAFALEFPGKKEAADFIHCIIPLLELDK